MEAQGYHVEDNILFQDNKSSMLLERNGKASSGKRTKHINIRYFFITDRVSQGEVSVVWCPTGDMIADFATKLLQGALFMKFRDQIMGVVEAKDPGPGKAKAVPKEPTNGKPGSPKGPAKSGPKGPAKSGPSPKKWKPIKGKSVVPPGAAAPQECVGVSRKGRPIRFKSKKGHSTRMTNVKD
jgi:hypothetical protein